MRLRVFPIALTVLIAGACGVRSNADERTVAFALYAPRGIPKALLRSASSHPGVVATGRASTTTLDLRGVTGAAKPFRRPRDGVLPVSVAALEPAPLRNSPRLGEPARALERGDAVLTDQSAALRGLDVGDRLTVGSGAQRREFRVGAVMPEDEVFDYEVLLPLPAMSGFPLSQPKVLVVAARASAAARIAQMLLTGTGEAPARIVPMDEPGPGSAVLSDAAVKRHFGEFTYRRARGGALQIDDAWEKREIRRARVPVLGSVKCHRKILGQLTGALVEIERRGLAPLIRTYNGCFVARTKRGNDLSVSRHSFGIALDVNASTNGFGAVPTIDPRIVEVFERWGFAWGGRFIVPDGMHFEWIRAADGSGS